MKQIKTMINKIKSWIFSLPRIIQIILFAFFLFIASVILMFIFSFSTSLLSDEIQNKIPYGAIFLAILFIPVFIYPITSAKVDINIKLFKLSLIILGINYIFLILYPGKKQI